MLKRCPECGAEIPLSLFMRDVAKLGGRSKSEAKKKASRENGKLGGRPRKQKKGAKP